MTKPKHAMPWQMAALRSRQPSRRYKPVGPVGDDDRNTRCVRRATKDTLLTDGFGGQWFPDNSAQRGEHPACHECGHHECSCERQARVMTWADGTTRACSCKNFNPDTVFLVDDDCHAHEYAERQRALTCCTHPRRADGEHWLNCPYVPGVREYIGMDGGADGGTAVIRAQMQAGKMLVTQSDYIQHAFKPEPEPPAYVPVSGSYSALMTLIEEEKQAAYRDNPVRSLIGAAIRERMVSRMAIYEALQDFAPDVSSEALKLLLTGEQPKSGWAPLEPLEPEDGP